MISSFYTDIKRYAYYYEVSIMICSNILLKEDTEDESKEVNENVIEEHLVGIEPLNGGQSP